MNWEEVWRPRFQKAARVAVILVIGSYLAGPGPGGFWHTAKGAYYSFKYPAPADCPAPVNPNYGC